MCKSTHPLTQASMHEAYTLIYVHVCTQHTHTLTPHKHGICKELKTRESPRLIPTCIYDTTMPKTEKEQQKKATENKNTKRGVVYRTRDPLVSTQAHNHCASEPVLNKEGVQTHLYLTHDMTDKTLLNSLL